MRVRKRQSDENVLLRLASELDGDSLKKYNEKTTKHKDTGNIALLFFLYTLQGIPLGISAAVPMILQSHNVSYKHQAEYSFSMWPFSLKLLWAPVVDSIFVSRFGRRKTWLIPTQYCIGIVMFVLSQHVQNWLGDDGNINVGMLTLGFFALNFLAATQDIAVDGWALTMLHKNNVGLASTCNTAGQTTGYFLGFVFFMALESAEFCNNYLRSIPQPTGMVSLSDFLLFWGVVFFVTTTLVALLKKEKNHADVHDDLNIKEAYVNLLKILKLPSIQLLAIILLTAKIPYSPADTVAGLKLIERGVSKEQLGLIAVPLIPFQVILVLFISKWTAGPQPLQLFIYTIPYRLLFNLLIIALVWGTPYLIQNGIPIYYYGILLLVYAIHEFLSNSMHVSLMSFFAKVSDPSIGGTYMTLLNTLTNLGGNWPQTLSLWLVDGLTWRRCDVTTNINALKNATLNLNLLRNNTCATLPDQRICKDNGGLCSIMVDGFYIECAVCAVFGCVWLFIFNKKLHYLQSLKHTSWRLIKKTIKKRIKI